MRRPSIHDVRSRTIYSKFPHERRDKCVTVNIGTDPAVRAFGHNILEVRGYRDGSKEGNCPPPQLKPTAGIATASASWSSGSSSAMLRISKSISQRFGTISSAVRNLPAANRKAALRVRRAAMKTAPRCSAFNALGASAECSSCRWGLERNVRFARDRRLGAESDKYFQGRKAAWRGAHRRLPSCPVT